MNKAVELVKGFEGFSSKAYLCPAGVPTIGYGHTGNVRPDDTITQEAAEALLAKDLAKFEDGVKKLVKVPLNDNQLAALTSFAYNVGLGNFKTSTLLKQLNDGEYELAADQLLRWTKAAGKELKGLVTRRAAERAVFLTPVEPA